MTNLRKNESDSTTATTQDAADELTERTEELGLYE